MGVTGRMRGGTGGQADRQVGGVGSGWTAGGVPDGPDGLVADAKPASC